MELEVGTFNIQRNPSEEMVQIVRDLQEDYPQRIFCLQEVSDRMREKLLECFPQAITHEENMIVYPEDFQLLSTNGFDVLKNERSFLSGTFSTDSGDFTVFTGKLPHDPWKEDKRLRALRILLGQMPKTPRIYALDTNFVWRQEHNDMASVLDLHHFGTTSHPEGTHDLSRLEPKNIVYKMLRWYGRCVQTRLELDKILYSNHFQLTGSHVRRDIKISDHHAVVASLRFNQ